LFDLIKVRCICCLILSFSLACNHSLLYRKTALSIIVNSDSVADGATFFSLALRRVHWRCTHNRTCCSARIYFL